MAFGLLNHISFSSLSNLSFFSIVNHGGVSFSKVGLVISSSPTGLNRSVGCLISIGFSISIGLIFKGREGGHGYVSV